jgi:hypothetical protein
MSDHCPNPYPATPAFQDTSNGTADQSMAPATIAQVSYSCEFGTARVAALKGASQGLGPAPWGNK